MSKNQCTQTDETAAKRSRGRPCAFDRDHVLQRAMGVFLEQGFDRTSIALLGKATGLRPPSLYAAFTNKEKLFLEVLDFYHSPYASKLQQVSDNSLTFHQFIDQFYSINAKNHVNGSGYGCLITNSTLLCKIESEAVRERLEQIHAFNEQIIQTRAKRAQDAHDLAPELDLQQLSVFMNCQVNAAALLHRRESDSVKVESFLALAKTATLQQAYPDRQVAVPCSH